MAKPAKLVETTCRIAGAPAVAIANFLGAKAGKTIRLAAHRGPNPPAWNSVSWNRDAKELQIGPHWNLWQTGSSTKLEGPEREFQVHSPATEKESPEFWRDLVKSLSSKPAAEFNSRINDFMEIVSAKKFPAGLEEKEPLYFTVALYRIPAEKAKTYGASISGQVVIIGCGKWLKAKR